MAETQIHMLKPEESGRNLCWSCKEEIRNDPLCPHCVKLQPLGRNSDFFNVMGLPRKLAIDARVLEPVFHALSRRFHPDMYRMATTRERMIALENSAVLNQAYRTLRDPFERAEYLLKLEEGRSQESQAVQPLDLFDEVLEIQELLSDYKFGDENEQAALRPKLEQKRAEMQAQYDERAAELTERLFPEWDALISASSATAEEKAPVLAAMRRILGERAYLKRVLNSLNEVL